jgi:curli biogenesis system outer membrane secretion channel CsgG
VLLDWEGRRNARPFQQRRSYWLKKQLSPGIVYGNHLGSGQELLKGDSMVTSRPLLVCAGALLVWGCATETHRTVTPTRTESKFHNRSTYLRGIFSDGVDRMGSQSKTILKTHLQETNRFVLVDRANMEEITREAEIRGDEQVLKGAQIVLTGDVTEFGRKTTGDVTLFGILGAGKEQVAYGKVALNVVDVRTSEVIYSVQGAGEFALSNRQVLGTGGSAGYDATLNGKVLDLAIREAVQRLVEGLESGRWHPTAATP